MTKACFSSVISWDFKHRGIYGQLCSFLLVTSISSPMRKLY